MKKISTLFMALALVLGVSAAPVFRPVEKKIEKHDLATDVQLAAPSLNAPSASMKDAKNMVKFAPAKKAGAEFLAPAKKVAAPKQAALADVSDSIASAEVAYFGGITPYYSQGDWALYLYGASGTFKGYMSFTSADSLHIEGSFPVTEGELVVADGDTVPVVGSLTITGVSPLGNYPVYSLIGSFTDSLNRSHSFNVQVEVSAISYYVYYFEYRPVYQNYQIASSGYCEYYKYFGYLSEDFDCDPNAYVADLIAAQNKMKIALEDMEFEPTGDTVNLSFEGFMKSTGTYLGESYTDFWTVNADSSYYFYVSFLANPLEEGLYDEEMMDLSYTYVYSYADSTRIYFEDISALVSFDGDTIFVEIDDAIGKDGVIYNITYKYFIPQPEEIVYIDAPAAWVELNDNIEKSGYFIIEGQGLDKAKAAVGDTVAYAFSIAVSPADTLVGDFADTAIVNSTDYTYVAVFTSDTTIRKYNQVTASLHTELNAAEDSLLVHFEYFAADMKLYIVETAISLVLPEAQDTVLIVAPDGMAELTNNVGSLVSYFTIKGTGYDYIKLSQQGVLEKYAFSVMVYPTDTLAGTFEDEIFDDQQYTYLAKFVTDSTGMYINKLSAKLTTTLVPTEDSLVVTYEFFGANLTRYFIFAQIPLQAADPYELDAEDNVADSFEKSEVTITDYTASDGLILVTAEKADGSATMGLIVYTNVADLMPGTYPIDTITTAPGHVLASIGEYDGSFYYSFYETLIDGDFDEVWFFTGGSVTVSATEVVINAVNSKGATATITINLLPTGIEDIKVDSKLNDVQKLLDGGKLIILRNSKFFDAAGRLVK